MRIRAPVLVLSVVTSLVLALTTAAPAAWARVSENGGPVTGVTVTNNSQGGTTTTVTTSNGSSSTVNTTSTSSSGTATHTTTTTSGGVTTSNSTSTSSKGTTTQSTTTTYDSTGNSQTTTTTTDSSGNQTKTTSQTTNGQTTSTTTVTAISNGTATVQQGSMVILSTSQNAQTQDNPLVNGVTVITLPQPTPSESESAYQQTLAQWLQQHPDAAQEIKSAQLAVTTGGTGWVSSVMNQALADITNSAVLQLGGSNAVTGAQMLVQAATIFASSGLSGLESDLNALASLSGGNGTANDPWAGSGYASNSENYTTGVSLYQVPTTSYTGTAHATGGGGSGGGTSCPPGDLGTPPNCYAPVLNPNPPASPQPSSQWYAIAVPAWMDAWLNVGQQSLGNGDQSASAAKNGGQDAGDQNSGSYVPTDPAGAKALSGGPVALLTDESAQVYGTYTETTTQTETEYKTVTVPEQETHMVAETQTVPGYWHNVSTTEPGYYSTETLNYAGYYASAPYSHPGCYSTETVNHPAHTGVTYVNGRPHAVYYSAYTTTELVWNPPYTWTELVWHPAYTTTEQVWHPPVTVTQAQWVPPTTETVEVPQTYTAYVTEQQAYTVDVPVTETLTGWHTVTSQVAQPTVLTSDNSSRQKGTAAAALYVAPVSAQSDPWLE